MKFRSFISITIALALVSLITAAGIGYWVLQQSPLNLLKGGIDATPTASIFVPRQAPVMVSLLANPDRLESLKQLATPLQKRGREQAEIKELQRSLLADTGWNYQQDIKPWLGKEITVSVTSLDYDRDFSNGITPGYLLAAQAKDRELAKEFLQSSFSQQAIAGTSDLVFEQYKGVNLIYKKPLGKTPENKLSASALVGDFVLFANHPKVIKDAINNVQARELNLENTSAYQDALKTIIEPRIALAFLNLPAVSAWIGNQPAPETVNIEQILTMASSIKTGGISTQTALIGVAGEREQKPALIAPVKALKYIPAESALVASGAGLNRLWEQISQGINPDSPLAQLISQVLTKGNKALSINLAENIFPWVKSEYALALLPTSDRKNSDWLFVVKKDLPETITAIEKIDELAKKSGLSVGNFTIGNTQVTAWTKLSTSSARNSISLDARVKGAHASVGDYEIFATSLATIDRSLASQGNSLLEDNTFKKAIAALPRENDGYFYLDWNRGKLLLEEKIPLIGAIELVAQPLFNNLQSLALSSQGSNNGVRRATLFLNLQTK